MKRSRPAHPRLLADDALGAACHDLRGATRERQQQDATGVRTFLYEVGDPVGQGVGLAGDDQQWTWWSTGRGELGWIEVHGPPSISRSPSVHSRQQHLRL